MPSQAMNRRKRDQIKVEGSHNPDEYENGKLRDKKQKKLTEFIGEDEKNN